MPELAGPRDAVGELAVAGAAGLDVAGGEGETGDIRDAIVAHVDADVAAVGEIGGSTGIHVGVVIKTFERFFDVVHACGICGVAVAPEFGGATLVSAQPEVDESISS